MPASRKKTAKAGEFERTFGPRPLPAHFGEIDVAAPFCAHRFFTLMRSVGANPYLWRHDGQGVRYCQSDLWVWRGGVSELHKRRFRDAVDWANAKDKDNKKTNQFLAKIAKTKPAGDFIHYLG